MLRGKKSAPKNMPGGTDNLGKFRKAKNTTGRVGGIRARDTKKGGCGR